MHAIVKEVRRDGRAGSVGVGDRVEENLGRLGGDRGATCFEQECLAEFPLEFLAERAEAVGWQAWTGTSAAKPWRALGQPGALRSA